MEFNGMEPADEGPRSRPRVFISYSHDSDTHLARVLQLAQTLRQHGVDVWLDRFERGVPDVGWSRWMEMQVERAEIVLVVCTATYTARFNGAAPRGVGLGAKYEGAIIRRQMLEAGGNNSKFRAIRFDSLELEHIPTILRDYCHVLPADYRVLHAFLTGQDLVRPEPLGQIQVSGELTYAPMDACPPTTRGFSVGVEAESIPDRNHAAVDPSLDRERDGGRGAPGPDAATSPGHRSAANGAMMPTTADVSRTSDSRSALEPDIAATDVQPEPVPKPSIFRRAAKLAPLIVFVVVVGVMLVSNYYGGRLDVIALDIEWQPQRPKVGEKVNFTARVTVAWMVRHFGLPWAEPDLVKGKEIPGTFRATWNIGGKQHSTEYAKVIESGGVWEIQFDSPAFDAVGSYRVQFTIDVKNTIDSEPSNNTASRNILIGAN